MNQARISGRGEYTTILESRTEKFNKNNKKVSIKNKAHI
jgi:hypothetical protein